MRRSRLAALGLALTLAGCQARMPVATVGLSETPTNPAQTQPDAARMGTLTFSVRWPERDLPGFSAQVIPISTRALVFELYDAADKRIAREVLRRSAGNAIASTTLSLPEGAGYRASVKAYAVNEPTDASTVLAQATAANLTVRWGRSTPVPLTLTAEFAPTITALTGHGTPGQTLQISGTHFDRGEDPPKVIFPSGKEVTGTLQDGKLHATIPVGAGTGIVKVRADGVTSETLALFQEVSSLSLSAAGEEREGGEAIATWLGDSFPLSATGKDTTGDPVPAPSLTGWSQASASIGALSPNGEYQALKLGPDVVTAHLGGLTGSRQVLVAPPAGPILRPAGLAEGIVDHSLTRVEDRWLVAWYSSSDQRLYWRMFNADGTPAGALQQSLASWDGSERVVRVSSTPSEVMLAYRVGMVVEGGTRNGIAFKALDPLTGAVKVRPDGKQAAYSVEGVRTDADRLNFAVSNGQNHVIGMVRFDGTKYVHRLHCVEFNPDGTTLDQRHRTYVPVDMGVYSYTDDAFSAAASGSQYIVARHLGTSNGAGPTSLHMQLLEPTMYDLRTTATLHERNRVAAVATNGTQTLVASMEPSATGTALKIHRYDALLTDLDIGHPIADLQIAGADPLNWPLEMVWDGAQFLLTYARKVSVIENGQVHYRPQAMVQALGTNGRPTGPAYPLAAVSQVPTLFPTAEGGMALWLDAKRSLIMRRVKYR